MTRDLSESIDADEIRALARDKGFVAQRALRPMLWHLVRQDGSPALDPITNDTGFSFYAAIDFLHQQPDDHY